MHLIPRQSAPVDPMSIAIAQDVAALRSFRKRADAEGRLIGLVPTMGALHDGHMQLIEQAALECDDIVVSIYVNPTQFAKNEDLSTYPVDFDKDYHGLIEVNHTLEQDPHRYRGRVALIFRPNNDVMYPFTASSESKLLLDPDLTQKLEGRTRPHFFGGVTTVVAKLFNIVQADRAYFGQKDVQQIVVVQRMIKEFHFPTVLRCVETVRENDGLAMSSRNLYLGARRRMAAIALFKILHRAYDECVAADGVSRDQALAAALRELERLQSEQLSLPPSRRVRYELDYISLADPIHLREVDVIRHEQGAVLSGALWVHPLEDPQLGEALGIGDDQRLVRLLDNLLIGAAAKQLGVIESPERKH